MSKFKRTMEEAFPYGPDYGCAIKGVTKPSIIKAMFNIFIGAAVFSGILALMLAYFDVLVQS